MESKFLYKEFENLINESFGPANKLKQIWGTSFEISPAFIEKYILPVVVNEKELGLKNNQEFDVLQSKIDSNNLDIVFFYDGRFLIPDLKRTSVKMLAVDTGSLSGACKGGYYHPKVMILRGEKKSYLITGSANLTLSGWARNIECISINEIKSSANGNNIVKFFQKTLEGISEPKELKKTLKELSLWAEDLRGKDDWSFSSSFDELPFYKLLKSDGENALTVWSPYFSREVSNTVEMLLKIGFSDINIVPDITPSGKIRIREENSITIKPYRLLKDRVLNNQNASLVHAKIWLNNNKIACGSWNFTQGGIGFKNAGNNVEAGIVTNIDDKQKKSLLNSLTDFGLPAFMTSSELEKEMIVPFSKSFQISVLANWETRKYLIKYKEQKESEGIYNILLPGGIEKVLIDNIEIDFENFYKELLSNKYFFIKDSKGLKQYTGLIEECNPEFRPMAEFCNLSDCMYAWLNGSPEKDITRFHEPLDDDYFSRAESEQSNSSFSENEKIPSYFILFQATNAMKAKLRKSKTEKDNKKEYLNYINVYPGSLNEWVKHMKTILEKTEFSSTFKWFLYSEIMSICKENEKNKTVKELIKKIDSLKHLIKLDECQMNKYQKFVSEVINNV